MKNEYYFEKLEVKTNKFNLNFDLKLTWNLCVVSVFTDQVNLYFEFRIDKFAIGYLEST